LESGEVSAQAVRKEFHLFIPVQLSIQLNLAELGLREVVV
jgi:hypothetical protein